jgi:hypothetical protein
MEREGFTTVVLKNPPVDNVICVNSFSRMSADLMTLVRFLTGTLRRYSRTPGPGWLCGSPSLAGLPYSCHESDPLTRSDSELNDTKIPPDISLVGPGISPIKTR